MKSSEDSCLQDTIANVKNYLVGLTLLSLLAWYSLILNILKTGTVDYDALGTFMDIGCVTVLEVLFELCTFSLTGLYEVSNKKGHTPLNKKGRRKS